MVVDVGKSTQGAAMSSPVLSMRDENEMQDRFARLRTSPDRNTFSTHDTRTSFQGVFNRPEFNMIPPNLAAYDPSQRYPLRHKVFLVPLTRVRHYVHRTVLETKIETCLAESCAAIGIGHAIALAGLGGMGKTQLVLDYIRRHHEDFNPILWINAQSEDTALSSIKQCIDLIGLPAPPERITPSASLAESPSLLCLYRWLNKRNADDGKWLMVLDSAEELTAGLAALIPHGSQGTLILTSRDLEITQVLNSRGSNMDWSGARFFADDVETKNQFCRTLSVGELDGQEMKELLLNRFDLSKEEISSELSDKCNEALDTSTRLTIEIDTMAAYLAHACEGRFGQALGSQRTPARLCKAICHSLKDAISENFGFVGDSEDHPYPVYVQYDKASGDILGPTLNLLERQHKTAHSLLKFFCLFPNSHFPDEILRLVSETLSDKEMREFPTWLQDCMQKDDDGVWQNKNHRMALKWLKRYALITTAVAWGIGATVKVGHVCNHASLSGSKCEDNQLRIQFLVAARRAVSKQRARVKQFLNYRCIFAAHEALLNHFFLCKCPKNLEPLFGEPLETFKTSFELQTRLQALSCQTPLDSQRLIKHGADLMDWLLKSHEEMSDAREIWRQQLADVRVTSYRESVSEWSQERWEVESRKVKDRSLSLEDEYDLLQAEYSLQQKDHAERVKQIEASELQERQEYIREQMGTIHEIRDNFEKAIERVYAEDEDKDEEGLPKSPPGAEKSL